MSEPLQVQGSQRRCDEILGQIARPERRVVDDGAETAGQVWTRIIELVLLTKIELWEADAGEELGHVPLG